MSTESSTSRLNGIVFAWYVILCAVILRLGYWQIWQARALQAEAADQYQRTTAQTGNRGRIFSADGHVLVDNTEQFRLLVKPKELKIPPAQVAKIIAPFGNASVEPTAQLDTAPPSPEQVLKTLEDNITSKIEQATTRRVPVLSKLTPEQEASISALHIEGLEWEKDWVRSYPEASLAAQVLGFVGKNELGQEQGYFGVEGALDRELRGQNARTIFSQLGSSWFGLGTGKAAPRLGNGRDVTLTIRRDIQKIVETALAQGMEKYQAKSGEVVIMEPSTGRILASAASPGFLPNDYAQTSPELFKHPSVVNTYEPGSTFKTLTVAAGVDTGVISPDTECPRCDGPRVIDKYTIRTWNDEYHPNITMKQALAKSDNVAMIYIAEKLGAETFSTYLKKFKIGDSLGISLQGDVPTPFPTKWGPVELATSSFGQGISTTSFQLVRAVAAIANQGVVMRPEILQQVHDVTTGQIHAIEPQVEGIAIKPETAKTVTDMMVYAAESGEAQWIASKTMRVAGKTGTSQVAVNGEYDPDKTIASFVGFAPADKPRFVMLVKLVEPGSSPWAAETAAPLWYQIANKLYWLLDIPPDK